MNHYLKNNNMKKIFYRLPAVALLVTPFVTFAAGKTLRDIIALIISYISVLIYLIISLAVVTFIWNVYRYFFTEKEKKEAAMYVLYSVIGFFIILSFWGLVALVTNSLKLPSDRPNFPFSSSSTSGGNNSIFNPPASSNSGNQLPASSNSGN